ncbi:MAG: type II toxin-antitoxin system VapC family toxin [Candidatus Marinimicrobia bacterium]|nr:type II toxin-antitoxin system VapC family toxin [Candidatus Neomarinimicrobiota bacterium]
MKLIYIREPLFVKAIEVFCEFKDKNWSFTDCTSYVVMKNLQIPNGASFDKHFREFGFKVLP